jgi:hypothetical protein
MKLTVPPQRHRSIIAGPVRAAAPQLIGKPFGGGKQWTTIGADSACRHFNNHVDHFAAHVE